MADATLTIPTKGLGPGDLRALLAMAEAIADEVMVGVEQFPASAVVLRLSGLRAVATPVAPITVTDRLPAELVVQPGEAHDVPAPDAEERPQRPRAVTAAADGAGSTTKRTPKRQPPAKRGGATTKRGTIPGSLTSRVLDLLADGPIDDPDGKAAAKIAARLDVNTNNVAQALLELERNGRIVRVRPAPRRTTRVDLAGRNSPPARPTLTPVPAKEPTSIGRRSDAPQAEAPGRGIVDQVRTEGLRDKLAARAEAAVE